MPSPDEQAWGRPGTAGVAGAVMGARGVRRDGYGRLQEGGRLGVGIAPIPPA